MSDEAGELPKRLKALHLPQPGLQPELFCFAGPFLGELYQGVDATKCDQENERVGDHSWVSDSNSNGLDHSRTNRQSGSQLLEYYRNYAN